MKRNKKERKKKKEKGRMEMKEKCRKYEENRSKKCIGKSGN